MSVEPDQTTFDVERRVKAVIADVFDLDPEEVGPATSKETIANWDSLQHLIIILALEEEFEIHFMDNETGSLLTFPLIVASVMSHLV